MGWYEDCDHDWETRYCERCGKYQGEECNICGEWYDGGDHMVSQEDIWCQCGPEDDQEAPQEAPPALTSK